MAIAHLLCFRSFNGVNKIISLPQDIIPDLGYLNECVFPSTIDV